MAFFLAIILALFYRNEPAVSETGLTTPMAVTPKTDSKLYKSSQLTPQQVSPNQQTYKMEGLAYFEARETESKPLVLTTDLAEITAVNAIFILESNAKETNVTVAEGLVKITPGDHLARGKANDSRSGRKMSGLVPRLGENLTRATRQFREKSTLILIHI